jgi:hypothetical protein
MPEVTECNNCGALLVKEDMFCGECGAPRTVPPEPESPLFPGTAAAAGPAPVSVAGQETSPVGVATERWRLGFILLLIFGALACVIAIAAFGLFGAIPSEDFATAENWLFSAFCCLLPIGAVGVALLTAGAAIWFTRLRSR